MFYVIVAKLGEITFHSTTGYVEAFLCRPPCFVYIIAQVLLELIFLHPSIKRYENYFYLYYFYLDFPACLSLGLGSVKWFYIDYTKHIQAFLFRPTFFVFIMTQFGQIRNFRNEHLKISPVPFSTSL